VPREETLCNLLPRDVTLGLSKQNPRFASFFYLDIAHKLDAASREEEGARFAPLLGARVDELFLHRAEFLPAQASIAEAGSAHAPEQVLRPFRDEAAGVGIVTRSDLLNAAILGQRSIDSPVVPLVRRPIVCVAADEPRLDRSSQDDQTQ
jgi:CBS domain-containing protein